MSTAIATRPDLSNKTTIQFPQTINFFDELEALSRETARRAFALFQQRGYMDGWDLDDWLRAESEILRPVPIEMSESDDSYTIRAEVPGFDAKNFSFRQTATRSTSAARTNTGKKKERTARSNIANYPLLSYAVELVFPSSINPEKITARLTSGILELTLPKAAPPKTVEVKAA